MFTPFLKFAGIVMVTMVVTHFIAASGGMIEHFVWFNEYPFWFAMITFIEILIQVAIMGPWTVKWIKQAGLDKELSTWSLPHAVQTAHNSK